MSGELESMDGGEPLEQRRHRHWYDRLMMLSDGVFAIAITFLASDIVTPLGWAGDWSSLWSHLAPQVDAYSMSFLVISIFWLAHRRFMAMILKVDAPVTLFNLIVLGLIALLPPVTRLINLYGFYPVSRMVYGGLIIAIGLAMAMMWGYAALVAKLVSTEVRGSVRWFLLLLMVFTPAAFLAITMTLPSPPVHGAIQVILIALFLIGWRLRLWTVRRLGGKSHVA